MNANGLPEKKQQAIEGRVAVITAEWTINPPGTINVVGSGAGGGVDVTLTSDSKRVRVYADGTATVTKIDKAGKSKMVKLPVSIVDE